MLPAQLQCPECAGWFSKYGLRSHQRIVHEKTLSVVYPGGRKNPWNKGRSQAIDARITGHSAHTRALCRVLAKGRTHSEEAKAKIRRYAVAAALGGHTSKQRLTYRTRQGSVVHLHSSYEVRVAQALDAAGVEWTRPAPLAWQDALGVAHRYYPDFYLPQQNVYLDPKNPYLQQKDRAKLHAVATQRGVIILVLGPDELTCAAIFAKISPP